MKSKAIESVCVFCASSDVIPQKYKDVASWLGEFCAGQGLRIVYGGAQDGLMGTLADAALAKDGCVVGVMPEILSGRERAHTGLSELHITKDMHERQQKMSDLADAFLILPGGMGTLAEFFEILTWKHIGIHDKPIVLLNIEGYWNPLLNMIDQSMEQGFSNKNASDLFEIYDQIEDVQNFFSA